MRRVGTTLTAALVALAALIGTLRAAPAARAGDAPAPAPGDAEPVTVGILPEHGVVVAKEAPPATRTVRKPRIEKVTIPQYAYELVDTYVTYERPVFVRGEGPLLLPQRVPDVRFIDVPVYGEVDETCGCASTTRRVVVGVTRREQVCGWKVVWVPAPGNVRVPQVAVRCKTERIPTGKQWQWVRKGEKAEERVVLDDCGRVVYDEVAEPVCGAAATRTSARVVVPCEAVTVIADPWATLTPTELEAYRSGFRPLAYTRRVLTRSEFTARRRAIETSGLGVDAPPSPRAAKDPAPAPSGAATGDTR